MRSRVVLSLCVCGVLLALGCSRPPVLDPRPSGMGVLKYRGEIPEEGEEEAFVVPTAAPRLAAPQLVRPSAADCPNRQT